MLCKACEVHYLQIGCFFFILKYFTDAARQADPVAYLCMQAIKLFTYV